MRKLVDRLAELTRRKYFRFGMVGILALGVTLVAAHPVLAQTNQSLGWTDTALSYLAAIALALAEVIGKLVIAVLDITIPVMQYQGFTTSPVVVAGWAIVRDVVNMFFVVVLIVIAMGTIFGHSRFQWKQQVPKLMIFALVINFSKTLCGLMIDFAQVVMITFANALKDIAGGNFIQLLGLGDIFSLSEKANTIAGSAAGTGPGASAFDWFASSVAAVLMMVWVLAVVVMLLFVLVYRVVMLWILIVLAPLAWFMGGQSVFKSDAYGEWWKNFICYTAIGPVITFFLWLTLAVAGSGFIAANDPGLSSVAPAGDLNSNAADFVTKIFEWQRLTSFVVGMAMLMVGFDAASKICHGVKGPGFQALLSAGKGVPSKIGGFVGGGIRKYGGKGLAAGYAGGKSLAAGTGAGLLAATAGGAGLAALRPGTAGEAARAKGLTDLSRSRKVPTFLATKIAKSGDERKAELSEKLKKASEEKFKGMSADSKADYLGRLADSGMPMTDELGRDAAMGLLAEAIQDPKMRERLEASGKLGKLYGKNKDDLKDYFKGTPTGKALDEFEGARPDLTGNMRVLNTMEDVEKIDPAALARLKDEADRGTALGEDFKKRMQAVKSNTKKKFAVGQTMPDGQVVTAAMGDQVVTVSAWDHYEGGMGSVKKQKAWKEGMTGVYEGMSQPVLDQVPVEELARHASPELLNRRKDLAAAVAQSKNSSVIADLSRKSGAPGVLRQAFAQQTRAGKPLKLSAQTLAGIDPSIIQGNADIAESVASSLDAKQLEAIAKEYETASAQRRQEMEDSIVANIEQSLDTAAASGDPEAAEKATNFRAYFDAKMDAATGNLDANISRYETRVNNMTATLADAQARGDAATATKIQAWLNKETVKLNNLRAAKTTPRVSRRS